jgi:hypothetical protein
MPKPKAITRMLRLLRDAPVAKLSRNGSYQLIGHDASVPEPGRYVFIPIVDAEDAIRALVREDARTRIDPSLLKRKRPKRKAVR